jgi:hypothetical protein
MGRGGGSIGDRSLRTAALSRSNTDTVQQKAYVEPFSRPFPMRTTILVHDPRLRELAAAFLVAGSLILFQVSFSRLISYKLFYHFVFFAISLSLLGLGAAGTYVAVRPAPPTWTRACAAGSRPR